MMVDSMRVFDKQELYTDCTVQVLRNSFTGDVSLGWSINPEIRPGRWHSMDEPPIPDACYLVLWKARKPKYTTAGELYYEIVWFDQYGWHTDEDITQAEDEGGAEVIFWMPLPEKQKVM